MVQVCCTLNRYVMHWSLLCIVQVCYALCIIVVHGTGILCIVHECFVLCRYIVHGAGMLCIVQVCCALYINVVLVCVH